MNRMGKSEDRQLKRKRPDTTPAFPYTVRTTKSGFRILQSSNPARHQYWVQQLIPIRNRAAMNGQPKVEQKKMYQQMRLNNRLILMRLTAHGRLLCRDSFPAPDCPWSFSPLQFINVPRPQPRLS